METADLGAKTIIVSHFPLQSLAFMYSRGHVIKWQDSGKLFLNSQSDFFNSSYSP